MKRNYFDRVKINGSIGVSLLNNNIWNKEIGKIDYLNFDIIVFDNFPFKNSGSLISQG